MDRETIDPHAELNADVLVCARSIEQDGLQIASVQDPIGRAKPRGCLLKRNADNFMAIVGAQNANRLWNHGSRAQPIAQTEVDQDATGVGGQLDAGARFVQPLRLIKQDHAKSSAVRG